MKIEKHFRRCAIVILTFIMISIPHVAVQAKSVLERMEKREVVTNVPAKTEITMIALRDTGAWDAESGTQVLLNGGSVVILDRHSLINEKVTVEYQDKIYYVNGKDFKVAVGTEEQINAYAQEIVDSLAVVYINESHDSEMARLQSLYPEYPVANYVWQWLRNHGYSEIISAAIIGYMMVECAGYTLDLKPYIYDSSGHFYGLCQWYDLYNGPVIEQSIETQLNFLHSSVESEFKTFGRLSGYTYNEWMSLTDERVAAEAFAATYERCGSGSYGLRRDCASRALAYFTQH